MNPSTQQHSFFAPLQCANRPRRKRCHSTSERPRSRPTSEDEPENDDEADQEEGGALDTRSGRKQTSRINAILTSYNLPRPPEPPKTLRMKHQAAMTVLLHRTLMEGDYARASRAFGLLLRCKGVDIRTVWGIGLDILLKRPVASEEGGDTAEDVSTAESGYRPENIAKALEFLNRLILQYPFHYSHHSHHPALGDPSLGDRSLPPQHKRGNTRPSVFEFYPALFTLLIKTCSSYPDTTPEKIRAQIETLTVSPPWTNMPALWLLRGMVCNWIADQDRGQRTELRREAAECFEKVRERGVVVPDVVESMPKSGDEENGSGEDERESDGGYGS